MAKAKSKKPAKKSGSAFFPIMPWGFTSWTGGVDASTFVRMRDCGFTLAGMVREKELPLCKRAGLKAILDDKAFSDHDWMKVKPRVARAEIEKVIKRVRKDPTIFGYYLKDEPPAEQFPGLAQVANLVRELHP
jgi:hypothetical protein